MPQEDKAHGSVSLKTYCLYFIAGGGYALLPFLVFLFLLAEVREVDDSIKINCREYLVYSIYGRVLFLFVCQIAV